MSISQIKFHVNELRLHGSLATNMKYYPLVHTFDYSNTVVILAWHEFACLLSCPSQETGCWEDHFSFLMEVLLIREMLTVHMLAVPL